MGINKKNFWRCLLILECAAIFLLLLWCNMHTPLLADDYAYMFHFSSGERIEAFKDIFSSMAAHRYSMNGRVFPHFFAQLFLMLPKHIFNVVNAAVFTMQLLLIYMGSFMPWGKNRESYGVFLMGGIFAALWIFEPNFGEVNLWLDGAVNYLWAALLAGFIFMISAPAEFTNKLSEKASLASIIWRSPEVFAILYDMWPLVVADVLLLISVITKKGTKDVTAAAIILFVGAMAGCFCLTIGTYIVKRNFFITTVFLVLAGAMLLNELLDVDRRLVCSALALLIMFLPMPLVSGLMDMGSNYSLAQENERYIMQLAAEGETAVSIPGLEPQTPYCAAYDLLYLDEEDPESWPNCFMADCYGVERIEIRK